MSTKAEAIEQIKVLDALISISEVDIILNTFIKTFIERAILKDDGCYYLHGNFNLGGTVSGRLSSSKPNMQNLPSTSKYAKHIKRCFIAPPGWVMMGADFASLEDRISALTTKDPNKLKVYLDHYDGHCLRAYGYFKDEMPDLETAEDTDRTFVIQNSGTTFYCKSGDMIVDSTGAKLPIEEYYAAHS